MNTKYLSIYTDWFFKKQGGLFFGVRVDFPTRICVMDRFKFKSDECYTRVRVTFGLVLFSFGIDFKYDHMNMSQQ